MKSAIVFRFFFFNFSCFPPQGSHRDPIGIPLPTHSFLNSCSFPIPFFPSFLPPVLPVLPVLPQCSLCSLCSPSFYSVFNMAYPASRAEAVLRPNMKSLKGFSLGLLLTLLQEMSFTWQIDVKGSALNIPCVPREHRAKSARGRAVSTKGQHTIGNKSRNRKLRKKRVWHPGYWNVTKIMTSSERENGNFIETLYDLIISYNSGILVWKESIPKRLYESKWKCIWQNFC